MGTRSAHLAIGAAVALGVGCGQERTAHAPNAETSGDQRVVDGSGVTTVDGLRAEMARRDVVLIDVRTPAEYAEGRVPGAVNVPLDQLESRLAELAPHRADDVYLICAVGGRSARATSILAANGFSKPINVDGGTNGWRAAGYPIEEGAGAVGGSD